MNRNNLLKLKRLISRNKKFLISSHINLEPDALGSELAFYQLLKAMGKKALILNNESVPDRYKFMPGCEKAVFDYGQAIDFDVAVILDCSDLNRIGKVREVIGSQHKLINIDHHISNSYFGDINIVEGKASSAAEMVYEIFKFFRIKISRATAFNLYCGILTDTGSFRYANTSSKTFWIAAQLVDLGLDVNKIYQQVYKIDKLSYVNIIGRYLQQAKLAQEGKIVYLTILPDSNLGEEMERDLADQALSILRLIDQAEVFVLFRRLANPDYVRINLRSNSDCDVNKIAKVFNGGGHARAASATIKGEINFVRNSVLKEIRRFL